MARTGNIPNNNNTTMAGGDSATVTTTTTTVEPSHTAAVTPLADAPVFTSPLDQVMSAYRDSYYDASFLGHIPSLGGIRNIGAGGGIDTSITSALTGGLLGSYGLGAKGNIQRVIDDMTKKRTGIDYNATTRVSDILVRADNQINSLSMKIRVCDELERDIDSFLAQSRWERTFFEEVKNQLATVAPVTTLTQERGRVSKIWHAIKQHPITQHPFTQDSLKVASRIAGGGALFLGAATLGLGAYAAIALTGVLPAGAAAALRSRKKSTLPVKNAENLNKALDLINTIRADARKKRDELLKHAAKKCTHEIQIETSLRKIIDCGKANPGVAPPKPTEPWYNDLLHDYEELTQIHSDREISAFIAKMKMAKNMNGTDAFTKANQDYMNQQLRIMFSSKAYIGYVNLANQKAIGAMVHPDGKISMQAQGPEQIIALIGRISQVNKFVYQAGRQIELIIGGTPKRYKIFSVHPSEADINLKEIVTPAPKDSVSIRVNKADHNKLIYEEYDIPTEKLIDEINIKTEDDLWCSDPHSTPPAGVPDAAIQKRLLNEAKKGRLSVRDYKQLWLSLNPGHFGHDNLPEIEKIATGSATEFKLKRVPLGDTDTIIIF